MLRRGIKQVDIKQDVDFEFQGGNQFDIFVKAGKIYDIEIKCDTDVLE